MRTPGKLGAIAALVFGTAALVQGCAAIIGADFGDDPVPLDAGGALLPTDANAEGDAEASLESGDEVDSGDAGGTGRVDAGDVCGTIDAGPTVLLSAGVSPQFFALTPAAVYVATGQSDILYQCALPQGCGATPTTLFAGKDVYGITADSQNVYATDYITGNLLVCALTGCNGNPQVYGPNLTAGGFGGGVRVAGSSVLWVDVNHVYEAPLSNLASFTSIATGQSLDDVAYAPGYLGGTVFWTDTGAATIYACQLKTCGTTTKPVITNQLSPAYLAVDANHVYWTDADSKNGSINQMNFDGTGAVTLASGQPNPWGIAVDPSCVYWADNSSQGSVKRCAIGGCNLAPSIVAANQATPIAVAVDGTYAYWSSESDGTVKRVPR